MADEMVKIPSKVLWEAYKLILCQIERENLEDGWQEKYDLVMQELEKKFDARKRRKEYSEALKRGQKGGQNEAYDTR